MLEYSSPVMTNI